MRTLPPLPIALKNALRKLGQDIRDARKRRRIPMTLMAERAFITRATLTKVEKGDPAVSVGIYASVLFAMGMISRLSELVDANYDVVGRTLEEENLPKRIHIKRRTANNEPPYVG
jgi:transcriptional regulator with XRE-family HTH domain